MVLRSMWCGLYGLYIRWVVAVVTIVVPCGDPTQVPINLPRNLIRYPARLIARIGPLISMRVIVPQFWRSLLLATMDRERNEQYDLSVSNWGFADFQRVYYSL